MIDDTKRALFIIDALDPLTDDTLHKAADELLDQLKLTDADLTVAKRLIKREA